MNISSVVTVHLNMTHKSSAWLEPHRQERVNINYNNYNNIYTNHTHTHSLTSQQIVLKNKWEEVDFSPNRRNPKNFYGVRYFYILHNKLQYYFLCCWSWVQRSFGPVATSFG